MMGLIEMGEAYVQQWQIWAEAKSQRDCVLIATAGSIFAPVERWSMKFQSTVDVCCRRIDY